MKYPEFHCQEPERNWAIEKLRLTNAASDAVLDAKLSELRDKVRFPIGLCSVVTQNKQFFKSSIGTDLKHTHRRVSFCAHAILEQDSDDIFVVENANTDSRFCNNPLVKRGPKLRTYVGATLRSKADLPLGTVCLLSNNTEKVDEPTLAALKQTRDAIQEHLQQRESSLPDIDRSNYDSAIDHSLGGRIKSHIQMTELAQVKPDSDEDVGFGFVFLSVEPFGAAARTDTNTFSNSGRLVDYMLRRHFLRKGDICFPIDNNQWYIGVSRAQLRETQEHLEKIPAILEFLVRRELRCSPRVRIGGVVTDLRSLSDAELDQRITFLLRHSRNLFKNCGRDEIALEDY